MKVIDLAPITTITLSEGKKKRRGKRIPTWFKKTSFRQGPFYGGYWGGYLAWGNDSGGSGSSGDGGGGD